MPRIDTKNLILDVSTDLFYEKGYDGCSMEDIAKACDIKKASIYYHFKSKYDIFLEIYKRSTKYIISEMKPINLHKNMTDEEIKVLVDKMFDVMEESTKELKVCLHEGLKKNVDRNLVFDFFMMIINSLAEEEISRPEIYGLVINQLISGITFIEFKSLYATNLGIGEQSLYDEYKNQFYLAMKNIIRSDI